MIVATSNQRRGSIWPFWVLVVMIVVAAASYWVFLPYGDRCASPLVVSQSWLRQAYITAIIHTQDREQVLPSFAVAVMDGSLSRHPFAKPEFIDGPEDVVFSGITLAMVRENPTLLSNITVAEQDIEQWEYVGRFMLSHETQAYQSYDSDVIVGLSRSEKGKHLVMLLFADARVETVSDQSAFRQQISEHAARDRIARNRLGLSGPIKLIQEIDRFRAERGLKPISK